MRTIIQIEGVKVWTDQKGNRHSRTHAVLDDGTEAAGYGQDFKIGDEVMVAYDKKWDIIKMIKKPA